MALFELKVIVFAIFFVSLCAFKRVPMHSFDLCRGIIKEPYWKITEY